MTKILITRPEDDSKDLATKLENLGFQTVSQPMLEISPCDFKLPNLDAFDAMIFTSPQAVRIFKEKVSAPLDNIEAYCVGSKTALLCKDLGFKALHNADGAAKDLAKLIISNPSNSGKNFLYCRGAQTSYPIEKNLNRNKINCTSLEIYEARFANSFSENTIKLLENKEISGITFFSKRTAEAFYKLAKQKDVHLLLQIVDKFCMSNAIAEFVRLQEKDEQQASVIACTHPNEDSFVQAITDHYR